MEWWHTRQDPAGCEPILHAGLWNWSVLVLTAATNDRNSLHLAAVQRHLHAPDNDARDTQSRNVRTWHTCQKPAPESDSRYLAPVFFLSFTLCGQEILTDGRHSQYASNINAQTMGTATFWKMAPWDHQWVGNLQLLNYRPLHYNYINF